MIRFPPSPRDHLSCGEIGTEYGLQRPKQSLFHRNFMGMCDNARRKTSAVFGGLSMLYEFCAENFERVPAAIEAGAGPVSYTHLTLPTIDKV